MLALKYFWSNTAMHSMLTRMYFHSATISAIFKDYNSLLMLQSSSFNVNITSKIPKFIGFMNSACRFDYCKEKMDLHASLHYQEYCEYRRYLFKLSGDYKLSNCSIFQVQAFWRHYNVLKVQISSNLTRNKSLELVLEHTLRLFLPYFWTFWSICALLYIESHQK